LWALEVAGEAATDHVAQRGAVRELALLGAEAGEAVRRLTNRPVSVHAPNSS
jgi:hypothetical protein